MKRFGMSRRYPSPSWRWPTLALGALFLAAACNSGPNSNEQTGGQKTNATKKDEKAGSAPSKESNVSEDFSAGPPPAPDDDDDVQDVSRYQQYLAKQGVQAPASELHEEERWRVGDWRFYYRGGPGMRDGGVALDGAGRAVTVKDKSNLHALLTTDGLDAVGAHKRLAWLMGRAGAIDANYQLNDAKAAGMVKAPTLERGADGSVTLTGWVIFPPNTQVPFRLVAKAASDGTATVETKSYDQL